MKKFYVIGNPIDHSMSPTVHNYWFKKNSINAVYEKRLTEKNEIEKIIQKIRIKEIQGINVTVPFKNAVLPFIDKLSSEAEKTKSVNTISLEGKDVVGHNTDVAGFELAIRHKKFDVSNKEILIIGAGGVVPSIIFSLKKMKTKNIYIMNRTKENAENIKKIFEEIKVLDWGKKKEFDMIINATSVGLNKTDDIGLDLENFGKNKFYYDVIYKPKETSFIKNARELGNQTENGEMMFIYQAHQAFFIWNKVLPKIDDEVLKLIN
tara:strand:+ start:876 stop:1667 length:792 start_codon:yes stop_codon:yes gene_type:complete